MLRYTLILSTLIGAILLVVPQVRSQDEVFNHAFQHCNGDFALCAASTCTPLPGVEIAVNTAAGGTRNFPAAECTCPIFPGPGLADVNGGNMKGNCEPPSDNGVWSLYLLTGHIPQEINNWNKGEKKSAAPIQTCSSGDFANCFSFACTRAGKVQGNVEVATCICPINESLEGAPAGPPFATPAGQCNQDICSQSSQNPPVGAYFHFDIPPGECLSVD